MCRARGIKAASAPGTVCSRSRSFSNGPRLIRGLHNWSGAFATDHFHDDEFVHRPRVFFVRAEAPEAHM